MTARILRALLGVVLLAGAGCALPRIHAPATALLHDDLADNPDGHVLLAVTGEGFGRRSSAGRVRLRNADGRLLLELAATDHTGVPLWSDQRLVLVAPAALAGKPALTVEVATGVVGTPPAAVAFFTYEHFDVPRTDPDSNPSPLAIAVDHRSRVAVVEEFQTQVKRFDPSAGWQVFDLPQGPTQGIFASELFNGGATRVSLFGEQIIVDPADRIWTTQGGWMLYSGAHPNHSRVVMIEADGGAARIWPVPGDDNSVVGIAYDPASERVWFTQAQRAQREGDTTHVAHPARLTSFDPRAIAPDARFDFIAHEHCERPADAALGVCSATPARRCFDDGDCVLAARVCRDEQSDDRGCFREVAIPTPADGKPLALPGPLLRHSDGTLWFSGYWGDNDLGRFDPASGAFQRFPLPRPPGEASCDMSDCVCFPPRDSARRACPMRCCLYVLIGRGPWGLAEDAGGNLAFTAQEAGAVALLPRDRFDDPRCARLNADGTNPCIVEYPLPNYDPEITQLHSVVADDAGNLWFGESRVDGLDRDPARGAALGYVQAGTGRVILLPPPSLYPYASSGRECRPVGEPVAFSATGIAFDPRRGAIWNADYCRKRLGRLLPLPPPAR
ncbi:MAG: hypothetical protein SF182_15100 [Deltaproteobacteria bacterium]|nr:hypothetical protein [Deltaproteobacteria bacterium]